MICGEVERAAVRIGADDAALVVDRHRLQLAGGEAVLLQQIDLHVAVRVGELRDAAGAVRRVWMLPSETPSTVTFDSVIELTAGLSWPLAPNV